MANKPKDNSIVNIGNRVTGTSNAQLQFSFETFDVTKLSIIFDSVGGTFNGQTVNFDVSIDDVNWKNITTLVLPSGPSANNTNKRFVSTTGTTIELLDFPYVRITVPPLGSGISCVVTYGGKP